MSLAARRAMGLPADPWRTVRTVPTADVERVREAVDAAIDGGLVSVVGPRGVGKTHAVREALWKRAATAVEPLRLDRDRLTLPDVLSAVAAQLSDESPRHSGEARAAQARRLLAGRGAVIVVDDAHLLHHQTVRGLRRLRELPWRKPGPICGVLLVGQRDCAAGIAEVALRTERVELAGLAHFEAAGGLERAYGDAIEPEARSRLAERHGNWLDLMRAAETALEAALADGRRRTLLQDVETARPEPPQPPTDDEVAAVLASRKAA